MTRFAPDIFKGIYWYMRPELVMLAALAKADRPRPMLKVKDLTIRCMLTPERMDGRIHQLVPGFDAIRYAPSYSWRCGKFDEILFSGSLSPMTSWLADYMSKYVEPESTGALL